MNTQETRYFDFILEARLQREPWIEPLGDLNHWGYWDDPRQASASLETLYPSMQRLDRALMDFGAVQDGMRILDVGCGLGGTLGGLNQRLSNVALLGLDRDPRLAEVTRRHVQPRPGNSVEVQAGCATALPWPDNSLDRVLAVECIFHFPTREAFMREALRVLKPGGKLVICDYLLKRSPWFLQVQRPLLDRSLFRWLGQMKFITFADYQRLAQQVGFSEVEERDVTENTLPTYPSRVTFFWQTALPLPDKLARMATMKLVGLVSREGFLTYTFLSFTKR